MATKTKSISPKRAPKLPEKLSDCLAVALGDLIKCERQKRTYRIDMMQFHEPNGHCTVCLAGAAMAQTLKADRKERCWPDDFSCHNQQRLDAISQCAITSLNDGVWILYGSPLAEGFSSATTPRYSDDRQAFKTAIRGYIKELRAHGL